MVNSVAIAHSKNAQSDGQLSAVHKTYRYL